MHILVRCYETRKWQENIRTKKELACKKQSLWSRAYETRQSEQDGQCIYNVTWRRVRATTVTVDKR